MKRKLEIAIISDVHLGTYGCHAKELLNYLKSIKPETLIINGDFIDVWQYKKSFFPKVHMQVINEVIKMAVKGTKVYYITGNHDDVLRHFSEFSTGTISLRDKLVLQIRNKKYWVFHGDVFDSSIRISPFIARMGGHAYDWLIRLNRLINQVRDRMGMDRMSFAQKVKSSVKRATQFIADFEQIAIQLAAEQQYDYVICGHIHKAQLREVDVDGHTVTYMNSGDWVESLTSLELQHGEWSIYKYDELDYAVVNKRLKVGEPDIDLEELINKREQSHLYQSVVSAIRT